MMQKPGCSWDGVSPPPNGRHTMCTCTAPVVRREAHVPRDLSTTAAGPPHQGHEATRHLGNSTGTPIPTLHVNRCTQSTNLLFLCHSLQNQNLSWPFPPASTAKAGVKGHLPTPHALQSQGATPHQGCTDAGAQYIPCRDSSLTPHLCSIRALHLKAVIPNPEPCTPLFNHHPEQACQAPRPAPWEVAERVKPTVLQDRKWIGGGPELGMEVLFGGRTRSRKRWY